MMFYLQINTHMHKRALMLSPYLVFTWSGFLQRYLPAGLSLRESIKTS